MSRLEHCRLPCGVVNGGLKAVSGVVSAFIHLRNVLTLVRC